MGKHAANLGAVAARWVLLGGVLLLSGCIGSRSAADFSELETIKPSHVFPKSSPSRFVSTFETFCLNGPKSLEAMERSLRSAGYVPMRQDWGRKDGMYVIDSKRPAVRVTQKSCAVVGTSRTGQMQAVREYVAKTFPDAMPIPHEKLDEHMEQGWLLPTDPQEIIGTGRFDDLEFGTRYAFMRLRDDLYSAR